MNEVFADDNMAPISVRFRGTCTVVYYHENVSHAHAIVHTDLCSHYYVCVFPHSRWMDCVPDYHGPTPDCCGCDSRGCTDLCHCPSEEKARYDCVALTGTHLHN